MNLESNKKKIWIIFISFGFIMSLSIVLIEKIYFNNNIQKVALKNALNKSTERENLIDSFLNVSKEKLFSLRNSKYFIEYLKGNNNEAFINELFYIYSKSNANFFQLRYIDKNGIEKVRIDRNHKNTEPYINSKDKLSNKSNRYYFIDSKSKELEKVWFSAVDLNIENKKVQIPYVPTLRAILPIEQNGEFGGILIINYFMDDFISTFSNTPLYDMILSNKYGETIYHYQLNGKVWGNSLSHNYKISKDFPREYNKILSNNYLKTDYFVSKKLKVPIYNDLYLVLQLNEAYLLEDIKMMKVKYVLFIVIVLFLTLILSFVVMKFFSNKLLYLDRINELNFILNKQSLTDELTKLQNRKAYNLKLKELLALNKRYHTPFSYVMIDIDHFKIVNDNYGHDVADKVLVKLASVVTNSIRQTDYVYRIGGEEFVVLLSDTKIDDATVFAEKIRKAVEDEVNTLKDRSLTISLGVTQIKNTDSIDSVYRRADECLYVSKHNGRNRVTSKI